MLKQAKVGEKKQRRRWAEAWGVLYIPCAGWNGTFCHCIDGFHANKKSFRPNNRRPHDDQKADWKARKTTRFAMTEFEGNGRKVWRRSRGRNAQRSNAANETRSLWKYRCPYLVRWPDSVEMLTVAPLAFRATHEAWQIEDAIFNFAMFSCEVMTLTIAKNWGRGTSVCGGTSQATGNVAT